MDQLSHIHLRQNLMIALRKMRDKRWVHLNSFQTHLAILRIIFLIETWTLNRKRWQINNLAETYQMMLLLTANLQVRDTSTTIITTSTVKVSKISKHSWEPLRMSRWNLVEALLNPTTTFATTATWSTWDGSMTKSRGNCRKSRKLSGRRRPWLSPVPSSSRVSSRSPPPVRRVPLTTSTNRPLTITKTPRVCSLPKTTPCSRPASRWSPWVTARSASST